MSATMLVQSLAKPTSKASKSKRFAAYIPGIDQHVDTWLTAKPEADRFISLARSAEDQILAVGVPALIDECRRAGKLEASIRLNDRITLTRTCRYNPIPQGRIDDVRAVLPEPRYFSDRLNISLTAEASADETFLARLIEALGPDEFAARFNVSRVVTPTEEFHRDSTLRRDVAEVAAAFIGDESIRCYKPSLRV